MHNWNPRNFIYVLEWLTVFRKDDGPLLQWPLWIYRDNQTGGRRAGWSSLLANKRFSKEKQIILWKKNKLQFKRDGNCTDLFDRSGMLHIMIFFSILGNVRSQQGNLFEFLVDAAALTSTAAAYLQEASEIPRFPPLTVQHWILNREHKRTEAGFFRRLSIKLEVSTKESICTTVSGAGKERQFQKKRSTRNFRSARIFILKNS